MIGKGKEKRVCTFSRGLGRRKRRNRGGWERVKKGLSAIIESEAQVKGQGNDIKNKTEKVVCQLAYVADSKSDKRTITIKN